MYESFYNSGLLQQFINDNKEYIFISNIDNLGATVDLSILFRVGMLEAKIHCTMHIFFNSLLLEQAMSKSVSGLVFHRSNKRLCRDEDQATGKCRDDIDIWWQLLNVLLWSFAGCVKWVPLILLLQFFMPLIYWAWGAYDMKHNFIYLTYLPNYKK